MIHLNDTREAEVVRIDVDVVAGRHGDDDFEFPRQVGRAVDRLLLDFAAADELVTDPQLVIGAAAREEMVPGVLGFFAAYVASRALPVGAAQVRVFQLVGVTAFVGYSVALWQMSIWYRRDWNTTIRGTVDGVIYALLTAGVFGWLWPR